MIPTRYNKLGVEYHSNTTWIINHGAGVLDIEIIGASGLLWTFPDASMSTSQRPQKTVTAGTTIVRCNDFRANSVHVIFWTTGCLSEKIDFITLPDIRYRIQQVASVLKGDVLRLPKTRTMLTLIGQSIVGKTTNVPAVTFNFSSVNTNISGAITNLPHATFYFEVITCPLITGDVSAINWVTGSIRIYGCTSVTGSLSIVSTNNNIYFFSNPSVSPAEYDQTIANCVSAGGLNKTLYISSRRTSASDADKATLISRGWTVNDSQI